MKSALKVEQQIKRLKERGMLIRDEDGVKNILLDVSYYRLGFYTFPFEKTFPKTNNRDHKFKKGTTLNDVLGLYIFDSELRWLLLYFLNVIEVSVKTQIIYVVSNHYVKDPVWFVNPRVMLKKYVKNFDSTVYSRIKRKPILVRHHENNVKDKYAPAWKTVEFMTLGNILNLYKSIKNNKIKTEIAKHYNCPFDVFCNYLETILDLRNGCAHGDCIYDMNMKNCIMLQPANISPNNCNNISGAIGVVIYMLKQIQGNIASGLALKLDELLNKGYSQKTLKVIRARTGLCKCRKKTTK